MAYKRLLKLDSDTEQRLRSYITDELLNHRAERTDFVAQIVQERKDYDAKPSEEVKTFPFVNACNIVIPLTAINAEAIHSRIYTTLFGIPQFVSVKAEIPEFVPGEKPNERYLDTELQQNMQIGRYIEDPVLEIVKHGTGTAKAVYEYNVRNAVIEDDQGNESEIEVVTYDGPRIRGTPITRFLMPFICQDPQTADWCGEEHSKTLYEVRQLEESGFFYEGTTDKLLSYFWQHQTIEANGGNFADREQSAQENRTPVYPRTLDWVELWLPFNTDGGSRYKEICVHYHEASQTFLAIRYNDFSDLRRPYRYTNYFKVEYRWNGVGVAKQTEQFMREVTTQHRQRIDNATVANCRMIAVKKLSGYGPGEPIFPGKIWPVDDMDDVKPLQMGEIYSSSYNNENQTGMYNQQRTGINETILGMPQSGTPGTATSDLARIQEGNKKFDYTYKNIKGWVDTLILDTVCLIKQYGSKSFRQLSATPEGRFVQSLYALPEEEIRSGLKYKIRSAGQNSNKLLDRNNWQMLFQMLTQYYGSMIQLAQSTGNEQMMMQISQHALGAGTEAMRQILETFDVRNIDRLLLTEMLNGRQPVGPNGLGLPNQAGIGGIGTNMQLSAMAPSSAPIP